MITHLAWVDGKSTECGISYVGNPVLSKDGWSDCEECKARRANRLRTCRRFE